MLNLPSYLSTYYLDPILLEREILRGQGKYSEADKVRDNLQKVGIKIQDTSEGTFWNLDRRQNGQFF